MILTAWLAKPSSVLDPSVAIGLISDSFLEGPPSSDVSVFGSSF